MMDKQMDKRMDKRMYRQTNGRTALSLLAGVFAECMSCGVYNFSLGSSLTCQCHACKCHAFSPLCISLFSPAFSSYGTCKDDYLKLHFLPQSVKQHCLSCFSCFLSRHNSNIINSDDDNTGHGENITSNNNSSNKNNNATHHEEH